VEIWEAICAATQELLKESGKAKESVAAVGFGATCSLAVFDALGQPLAVSDGQEGQLDSEKEHPNPNSLRNVILACAASTRHSPELHISPEFLGNRSPHSDPSATAAFVGVRSEGDEEGLVQWFLAVLASLCYGIREIMGKCAVTNNPDNVSSFAHRTHPKGERPLL